VPTALGTHPELVGCPLRGRGRIAQFHLRPTALTPDVQVEVGHGVILYDAYVIPAVVLAAGKSTRMGRLKANLPVGGGDTFLTRIVRTFLDAGIDDVVVVVGHEADAILSRFATSGLPARFVHNRDFESGQLSSIVAGLAVVDRPGVAATLMTLVDVPFVTAATVRAVVERYRNTHALVVRPSRGDEHGHPLLIDRTLFAALRRADPATGGAKPVVRAHATVDSHVTVADPGAFTDIDTAADYESAIKIFGTDGVRSAEGA
jgi:molybdenum cofactor cytidylyltransferase